MFLIGAIAAAASLFRYDTGVALFGVHLLIIEVAVWTRAEDKKLSAFAFVFWPYLLGFAIVILPPLLYFLSLSSIDPFIHDIIIYPGKYYHRGRNLPFPTIRPKSLETFSIYLPLVIIPLSFFVSLKSLTSQKLILNPSTSLQENRKINGFLFAFSLLASIMYLKGFVRISPLHLYLATIPSLFLIAILFQRRFNFRNPLPVIISILAFLSLLAPFWLSLKEIKGVGVNRLAFSPGLFSPLRDKMPLAKETWCKMPSPATRGLCFIPRDSDIHVAEFIDANTTPDDRLFVGLRKHDRIMGNDIALYFFADRLPATRWAHFDPDLQTRADIQQQIISELTLAKPPYIILDSEDEGSYNEPNDSSKSSGVFLLDNYIQENYRLIQTFDNLFIWQRIPSA
jgi:hypothetical protein